MHHDRIAVDILSGQPDDPLLRIRELFAEDLDDPVVTGADVGVASVYCFCGKIRDC